VARPLPRWVKALAAAVLLFAHVYALETHPHWFNPNQISRVHLTLAVLSERKFTIDRYLPMIETEDKSTSGGHFYSDKAPGTSVWLVPFAWVLSGSGPHDKMTDPEYRRLMYGMRILGVSIPTVLFWLAGFRWYRNWAGTEARALAAVLAGALATNCFVYATHIFGVVPCAITLFCAFMAARFARSPRVRSVRSGAAHALLAGALAGLSFLFDPLSGFAIGVIGLYLLTGERGRVVRALAYAVGGAGPFWLWTAYNTGSTTSSSRIGRSDTPRVSSASTRRPPTDGSGSGSRADAGCCSCPRSWPLPCRAGCGCCEIARNGRMGSSPSR
jgi:hypothetical protein